VKKAEEYLIRGLEAWGVDLPAQSQSNLILLLEELIRWNQTFSFTSLSHPQDLVEVFLLDPLAPLALGMDLVSPLLDAGCGPGFPSLPLKVALPSLEVTGVEASRKKINFLRHVLRMLKLTGYYPCHKRLEDTIKEGQTFPTVVSRALAGEPQALEILARLLSPQGEAILYVGKEWKAPQLSPLLVLKDHQEYILPFSLKVRALVRASRVN